MEYPLYLSDPAVAFTSALLRHNVIDRLGFGPMGKDNIKSHRFMAGELVSFSSPHLFKLVGNFEHVEVVWWSLFHRRLRVKGK